MKEWTKAKRRFWFGVLVTGLWLLIIAFILNHTKELPTKLNEWGDFCAGFFSPLALFWIVLGYLQQGDELQASTKALEMQALELKASVTALNLQTVELQNSVRTQGELVEVSRLAQQQELESIRDERARRKDLARPKFFIISGNATFSSGVSGKYICKLANRGALATRVQMTWNPPDPGLSELFLPSVDPDGAVDFGITWRFDRPLNSTATLKYRDADNEPGEVQFTVRGVLPDQVIFGDITRVP
jgi:hypothetical protein